MKHFAGQVAEIGLKSNALLLEDFLDRRRERDACGNELRHAGRLNLVTAVFGPRYTLQTRGQHYAVFGEGLVGISNGFHSLFSDV